MAEGANAAQVEFWNGEVGQRWLAHEAELDAMNGAITRYLVEAAGLRPDARILEIGCGSGALSLALARAVPRGEVLALDISAPLLARARERQAEAGLHNLTFREADAQTADLPQGHFDLLISQFGVMFFADPVAAFVHLRAALRPGGRLLFACFAAMEANPWLALPRAIAARHFAAPPDPPPGAPGPTAFADIGRVTALLAEAGFAECRGEARRFDFTHPGGVAAAARLATILGPAAFILRQAGASEDQRRAVAGEIAQAFAPYAAADGVRLPVTANVFTARAP
jgi:SAM-dependent methyltransferase